jgi:DNA-binding MarR family transcriptional regulator
MSRTVDRLRTKLSDKLLVRVGRNYEFTPQGTALLGELGRFYPVWHASGQENLSRLHRAKGRATVVNARALYICSLSVQINCICVILGSMNDQVSPSQAKRASALAAELRAIFGKLKRKLREQGGQSDLTPSQVSVLLRIEKDGPAAVSSLARAEGMRPQSMSAIITLLLEAGLVSGSSDPNDRRQTLISLSRKCQKLLKDGRAARQDWLTTTIQKKLSSKEQEKLAVAVNLLARLIED